MSISVGGYRPRPEIQNRIHRAIGKDELGFSALRYADQVPGDSVDEFAASARDFSESRNAQASREATWGKVKAYAAPVIGLIGGVALAAPAAPAVLGMGLIALAGVVGWEGQFDLKASREHAKEGQIYQKLADAVAPQPSPTAPLAVLS